MAEKELIMPKLGESIMEATILNWLKKEGEWIEEDESVLEVATDKVDTEVPSVISGRLKKILFQKDEVVQIGKPIAILETERESEQSNAPTPSSPEKTQEVNKNISPVPEPSQAPAQKTEDSHIEHKDAGQPAAADSYKEQSSRFYSPLVLNIAKSENISMPELESVPGSGKGGRVTKKDMLQYLDDKKSGKIQPLKKADKKEASIKSKPNTEFSFAAHLDRDGLHKPNNTIEEGASEINEKTSVADYKVNDGEEIVEMDRMRKMIADRMLESKRISPHVTSFVEADVTKIVNWRSKMKHEYKDKEHTNLTLTPILIEALAKALKEFPMVNCSLKDDKIILKKDINIGMAVALPSGNLIVPVIHNADQYNLVGLTKKVNDLAKRARNNELKATDLENGTYSMSNIGSFGNLMGTPIIVQPQVAIMAFGTVKKKPTVIETDGGDIIGIRQKMFLSHSYDHRIIDGALGGKFAKKVADLLENFDTSRYS